MKITFFIFLIATSIITSCSSKPNKHLFILSGQSNMARLDLTTSFTPTIENTLGKANVTIVKHAIGGQPIRQWYVDSLVSTQIRPHLYESLFIKIKDSAKNKSFDSVTFLWMQGERDAREDIGETYKASLLGLYNQLSLDLKRKDINFVIGRLSDFDMNNERYPDWTMVRNIHEEVGNSNTRFDWINTDDLNDGLNKRGDTIKNDLHMSVEGYKIMGQRFADKAIKLINKPK
jgi:hypothetical protein